MGGDGTGFAALAVARQASPNVPAIVLARESDPERVAAAARLGAVGYILKSVSPDDLPVLVRAVLSGSVPFLGSEASTAADWAHDAHGLSSRELQILQGVAGGLTNKAIGRELWLSEQTVVGSSPIIRSSRSPGNGAFLVAGKRSLGCSSGSRGTVIEPSHGRSALADTPGAFSRVRLKADAGNREPAHHPSAAAAAPLTAFNAGRVKASVVRLGGRSSPCTKPRPRAAVRRGRASARTARVRARGSTSQEPRRGRRATADRPRHRRGTTRRGCSRVPQRRRVASS
ncbi:MAG: LuxR C-terminal-related transcriptional regulator [Gaiellaceae bacterium]